MRNFKNETKINEECKKEWLKKERRKERNVCITKLN